MSRTRLIALALCAPLLGASYWPMTNDADVAAGQESFSGGDYAAAVLAFRKALRGKGVRSRLHFNLGTALLQRALTLGDRAERDRELDLAIVSLRQASSESEGPLRTSARYNLGNALLVREQVDEAIASYRQVLREDSEHDDARHNLELALLVKRSSESGDALAEALRDLAALPTAGEAGTESGQEGQEGTAEGAESTGEAEGESTGEERSGASSKQAGNADATGEKAPEPRGGPPDPTTSPRPRGNGRLSLTQKLDALERRSGELRRANMLRKTESRLRMPNEKRRDQ